MSPTALAWALCLWPHPACPCPDTDAEAARVTPDLAVCHARYVRCLAELEWIDAKIELEHATETGDPRYYRALLERREAVRWLRDVRWEAYEVSPPRVGGHMRRLYDLVGPDVWRRGRDALPWPAGGLPP